MFIDRRATVSPEGRPGKGENNFSHHHLLPPPPGWARFLRSCNVHLLCTQAHVRPFPRQTRGNLKVGDPRVVSSTLLNQLEKLICFGFVYLSANLQNHHSAVHHPLRSTYCVPCPVCWARVFHHPSSTPELIVQNETGNTHHK